MSILKASYSQLNFVNEKSFLKSFSFYQNNQLSLVHTFYLVIIV